MNEDRHNKIDIPESIDGYKITLFWGLTITQIVLVFIAVLCVGFGIVSITTGQYFTTVGMFLMAAATLLGIVEIRGRNFYRHLSFIFAYYKHKPRVLIYHHYAGSGLAAVQAKQLVYQKEDNTKTFIMIIFSLLVGVVLLGLIAYYLFYVLHP